MKINKFIKSAVATAVVFASTPASIFALAPDQINIVAQDDRFRNLNQIRPSSLISAIINFVLGVAGVLSFIWLLWGGIQWILSGGDKEGTEKARKRITAALIGLAIVFSAYALIYIIQVLFQIDIIQVNLQGINGA